MKPVLRLGAVAVVVVALGLLALPFLVAAVIAGQLQDSAQMAAQWDIPPELVPALQDAGRQFRIPWFLLAGIASVATDFARHAPDGIPRGDTTGTAIFPEVVPPIGHPGAGEGMFLVDPGPLGDPQDVRDQANRLAARLAALTQGNPLAQNSLSEPGVALFWQDILRRAPLAIPAPAVDGAAPTALAPGDNPIQQFGSAVLSRIRAPITAGNLGAFAAWAAGEGTCARFNPLATTQPEPGATPFNNLGHGGHVWNYPSMAVGVQATTTALTNGLYQQVIAAFQADAGVDAVAAAVERSPWGTHHFGSPTYAGRPCAGAAPAAGAAPPTLPTITGADGVDATIVARAIQYQAIWSQMEALAQLTTTTTT